MSETINLISNCKQWQLEGGWEELGQVLPVLAFDAFDTVEPIVDALLTAGIKALEITLRTPIALEVISHCANKYPDCAVGAGTVIATEDVGRVHQAGAQFALSPGWLPTLQEAAHALKLPFIPGVSTASEVMAGLQYGVSHFKFFPAVPAGGVYTLSALSGPLPHAKFCPTGGITEQNGQAFLAQRNVFAIGMTRLVPSALVEQKDWVGLSRHVTSTLATLKAQRG